MRNQVKSVRFACGVFLLSAGLSTGGAETGASGSFVLAERGVPGDCRIEMRAEGPSVRYAATELADYVERLTGVRLATSGTAAKTVVLESGDGSLGDDAFRLFVRGDELHVVGGKRGILYGVYEVLERFGGVGWFSSWHEVVPRLDRLAVPADLDVVEKPAFELREPFWFDANENPEFAARIRKNNALWGVIPERMGGVFMPVSKKYRGHTFDLLVPPQEFGRAHPEYFSEIKGRRVTSGRTQLCLTNPDVLRIVTERLREQMRKEPEAKLFSLAPNDWYVYCECSNCAAIAKADGTTAGPYVRFVDAVARNLIGEFPDRLIRSGAYQWYRRPPKNFGRYPKNVLCSFAPIECDFAHPIAESPYKENVDTAQDLVDWGRIASGGIRVFDYSTAFWDYPHAFPNLKVLKPNLLFYRRNNVRYVINEGDHTGDGGSLAELKAWLGAKLMWNPDQEVEPLVDRFIHGFYGKAAPQVARYVRELESLPRDPEKEPLITCGENVFTRTMDDAWLDRALALWNEAEAAVKDDPKCLKNVRLGKFSVAYTILRRNCPKVIATSDLSRLGDVRSLVRWTVDFMESWPTTIAFKENVRNGRKTSAFAAWKRLADGVAVAPGPAEENVFDFVQKDWVVAADDPTASGGKAAKIDPKFWGWCLQMKARDVLAKPGERYRYRVRARADFREGAERKGVALSGGFSNRGGDPAKGFQGRITSARITDSYAWYDLGTWSPTDAADPYFWLSLGQFDRKADVSHPDVTAVWVDQIAFEPESPTDGSVIGPIVVPARASAATAYAAEELRDHVFQATGRKLAIVRDAAAKPGSVRLVETDEEGTDGFRIAAHDGAVEIRGSAARGVLYGAYEFLERFVGVVWCESDFTFVPRRERIVVPKDFSRAERPAFAVRECFWYDVSNHPEFAARQRTNCRMYGLLGEKFGGDAHRFGGGLLNCHTFNRLLPVEKYYGTHPEYFSEINGRRIRSETQLCLSNPDVLAIVTSNVLAAIRRDPTARNFGVSQNDWLNGCECAKCRAIDAEEGSKAGSLIRFVNAVAEAVEKEHPDKVIETLAYQYTRKPPKLTKPRGNVMVCLCSIECDFGEPLATGGFRENVSFSEDLRNWGRICPRLYVWDYTTAFHHFQMPFPNERVLKPNLRLFRDAGVTSVFEQGNHKSRLGDLAALKAWMISKLMWNPDRSEEKLVDAFCRAYYGAAAPFVKEYLALRRTIPAGKDLPLGIWTSPSDGRLTDDFIRKSAALWEKAAAAVKGDAARERNVRRSAISTEYVSVLRLAERPENRPFGLLAASADLKSGQEPARRFLKTLDEERISLAESASAGTSVRERIVRLANGRTGFQDATGPESLLTLMSSRYGSFVDDPEAEDGRALELNPASWQWAGQMTLTEVGYRPGDRIVLSVRVRAVKRPDGTDGTAFTAGVWDPVERKSCGEIRVKASEAGDGYRWYDVVDWQPKDRQYFWIASGKFDTSKSAENPSVNGIRIDSVRVRRSDRPARNLADGRNFGTIVNKPEKQIGG